MKWLMALHMVLAVPLLVIIGLAITLGHSDDSPQRSPISLNAMCALPCWRGIEPGAVFIARANRILTGEGYTARNVAQDRRHIHYFPPDQRCAVRLEHTDAVVTETRFLFCPDLRAGDVINAMGKPHSLSPNFLFYRFGDGVIRVRLRPDSCQDSLSPNTQVAYVSLSVEKFPLVGQIQWQGFAPNWRYFRESPHVPPVAC